MNYLIEFEYLAEEADELTVTKGDIVREVRESEDGWVEGLLRGKRGVFPSNFGKQMPPENNNIANSNPDTPLTYDVEDKKSQDVVEEQKPQPKKVMGVGFGDIFSGKQIQLKHTSKPDNKPQVAEDHPKPEVNADKKVGVGSVGKVELVKAVFAYKAENPDELQIEEGEIITIVDKKSTDEGWWKGKLNNKVGVFPNNFVEPYSLEEVAKPLRPAVVKKNPPPAPLTAKPNAYKLKSTPTRPPNPEPAKVMTKNISLKVAEQEQEEVTFESPGTHKPLVGPTIERVRRTNIRLPKKIAQSNNDEDAASPEINKTTLSFEKSTEETNLDNSITKVNRKALTLTREKSVEDTPQDPKTIISKTGTLKDRFTEVAPIETSTKFVYSRDKNKDAVDSDVISRIKSADERPKESPSVTGGSETVAETKTQFRPKSQFVGNSFLKDVGDQDDLKKKVTALELKVTAEQETNASLRKELTELSKSTADQLDDLTNTVKKLLKSFEDEKAKRLDLEDLVEDLKTRLDDLDES